MLNTFSLLTLPVEDSISNLDGTAYFVLVVNYFSLSFLRNCIVCIDGAMSDLVYNVEPVLHFYQL